MSETCYWLVWLWHKCVCRAPWIYWQFVNCCGLLEMTPTISKEFISQVTPSFSNAFPSCPWFKSSCPLGTNFNADSTLPWRLSKHLMMMHFLVSLQIGRATKPCRADLFPSHAFWHRVGLCCQPANLLLFLLTSKCSHHKVCFRTDLSSLKLTSLPPPPFPEQISFLSPREENRGAEVWDKRREIK